MLLSFFVFYNPRKISSITKEQCLTECDGSLLDISTISNFVERNVFVQKTWNLKRVIFFKDRKSDVMNNETETNGLAKDKSKHMKLHLAIDYDASTVVFKEFLQVKENEKLFPKQL